MPLLRYAFPAMNPKQLAGEAALEFVSSNMVVGLGTGSTADFFLIALGGAIQQGKLRGIRGVPTSRRSEERARELGIPLMTLAECPHPDVAVDGADEITPELDLIKGLGGALLREKIVEQSCRKLVIIADESKRVDVLGTKGPLPVEVATFAHETQADFLRLLGCEPTLRSNDDGSPYVTDNSNYIYHCRFNRIDDPQALQLKLKSHAGIIESGLFLAMAKVAVIASPSGVTTLKRRGGLSSFILSSPPPRCSCSRTRCSCTAQPRIQPVSVPWERSPNRIADPVHRG
jgi:ribose 5-phosphate isomerase A